MTLDDILRDSEARGLAALGASGDLCIVTLLDGTRLEYTRKAPGGLWTLATEWRGPLCTCPRHGAVAPC